MSRIRTIKPDAFKSESLSNVPRGARWTFAGLWTYVDDAGRGRADVRLIKAELYPLDDATTTAAVDEDMSELIDAGCLHVFTSGGREWIHIPGFSRHQKINRPTPATSPECPCEAHGVLMESSNGHGPDPLTESSRSPQRGKGREGKGNGREGDARATASPTPAATTNTTTRPPRSCPKHPKGTTEPCGPCADARKTADAWRPPTPTPPRLTCEHGNRPSTCLECAALVADPPRDWRPARSLT